MASKKVPSIEIVTSDYATIAEKDNYSVIHIFMNYEQNQRRSKIPAAYDGYLIRRYPDKLIIALISEAEEIFRVIFVPDNDNY